MPSEASCTNEIKVRALLNQLQDTASFAVMDREGSPSDLMRRGYAWVLLRYGLEVVGRLPGMGESIMIETRHTANDGFHTLRAFRVFSVGNEATTLILAKTSWVLVDLAAGRPVRAARRLPEVFSDVADDPPIDPDFAVIPKLLDSNSESFPLFREVTFPVRFHDLDANGHVNNAVYFEWAYEATPLDLLAWGMREMHAEFRVSAKFGEAVVTKVRECPSAEAGTRAFVYDMMGPIIDQTASDRKKGEIRSLARFYGVWAPLGELGKTEISRRAKL
jgi:medium-chain acyl-[acyl-carrier-protein] hydrolase